MLEEWFKFYSRYLTGNSERILKFADFWSLIYSRFNLNKINYILHPLHFCRMFLFWTDLYGQWYWFFIWWRVILVNIALVRGFNLFTKWLQSCDFLNGRLNKWWYKYIVGAESSITMLDLLTGNHFLVSCIWKHFNPLEIIHTFTLNIKQINSAALVPWCLPCLAIPLTNVS